MLSVNHKLNFLIALLSLLILLGCNEPSQQKKTGNAQPLMVVEKVDADFISAVHNIVNAEIAAGKLAMEKGTDKRIKNFGRIMVKDYTKGLAKLQKLAADKRIPLPDSLLTPTANKIAEINSKGGKDFDHAYIEYITADHESAIDFFEQAQKNCFDKDVKTISRKGILVFKRHLEAIFAIRDSMK